MVCCKCVEGFNCKKTCDYYCQRAIAKVSLLCRGRQLLSPAAQTEDFLAGIYDRTK